MEVCNCSMFCCTLLYVHSSIAITLMGKRELIALLNLSSWCLVMVERLFLAMRRGCLRFVIVVFPDHTHLPFLTLTLSRSRSTWDYRLNKLCGYYIASPKNISLLVSEKKILKGFNMYGHGFLLGHVTRTI